MIHFICGLDEAGRGPLAGPVSAGAVILPPDFPIEILDDSKKLSEKKRLAAEPVIKERACWAVAFVSHEIIDKINILEASMLAMRNAYLAMMEKFPAWLEMNALPADSCDVIAIADGNRAPSLPCEVRAEVKADGKYAAVMAASILAKNSRDRLMYEYDKLYPEYGYARHKGYPTKAHRDVCRKIGPSPIQRLTFSY